MERVPRSGSLGEIQPVAFIPFVPLHDGEDGRNHHNERAFEPAMLLIPDIIPTGAPPDPETRPIMRLAQRIDGLALLPASLRSDGNGHGIEAEFIHPRSASWSQ
jgi:hypothetical protein